MENEERWDDFWRKRKKEETKEHGSDDKTWGWRKIEWKRRVERRYCARYKSGDWGGEREDKSKDEAWWKERVKGEEGERSIVSFIPAFRNTPDYFSRRPYCDNVLIVVHFWKIARHECAFKIAGRGQWIFLSPWSFGIPYAETSWEDRPGIDATPNTARDFLLLVFASFVFSRFLKGFRGFFNELILCPPHWKYRRRDKTQSFLSLLFSFLLFHFFNPKINLKKKNHTPKFIQKERNSDPSINSNLVFEFFNKLQHKSIEKIRRRLRNRKPRLRILLKDFDYFIRVKKKKKKIKYTQIHGTISRYN